MSLYIVLFGLCVVCPALSGQVNTYTKSGDLEAEDVRQTRRNVTGQVKPNQVPAVEFVPFQQLPNQTNGDTSTTSNNSSSSYSPVYYQLPNSPSSTPVSNGAGAPDRREEHPIINGLQVPPSDSQGSEHVALAYQWHVGIYSKSFTPYMQICGGTLVTLKSVISAAHCFWSDVDGALPPTQFAAAAGKRYRPWSDLNDTTNQKSDVSAVHIPPRFRGVATNFQGDIAVVLLARAFTQTLSVKPACVSFDERFEREQLQREKIGTVLGWGLTQEDGRPSPVLNYVELPYVEIDECLARAAPDFLKYITADKICAGVTTGKALCRGDSGGGWVVPDTTASPAVPYLRGVASTAPRNAHALGALTHVLSHRDFILQHAPEVRNECRRHYPAKVGRKTKNRKFVCNCYCNKKDSLQ